MICLLVEPSTAVAMYPGSVFCDQHSIYAGPTTGGCRLEQYEVEKELQTSKTRSSTLGTEATGAKDIKRERGRKAVWRHSMNKLDGSKSLHRASTWQVIHQQKHKRNRSTKHFSKKSAHSSTNYKAKTDYVISLNISRMSKQTTALANDLPFASTACAWIAGQKECQMRCCSGINSVRSVKKYTLSTQSLKAAHKFVSAAC